LSTATSQKKIKKISFEKDIVMKNILFFSLLSLSMSSLFSSEHADEYVGEKNGVGKLDCKYITQYNEALTCRQVYFDKIRKEYSGSLYCPGNQDILWLNPPQLENPEQVYRELEEKFNNK
jgi:hypothetical protein